ncbi:MAG: hypothetical protein Q4C03_03460, partial [bacterium]|nr:hypothetical protein [bacterium]
MKNVVMKGKENMTKRISLLSILLVLLLALAGCGNTKPAAEATEADTSQVGEESTEAATSQLGEDTTEAASEGYIIFFNTEGMGQIAYAKEGEEVEFNDDQPFQSGQITLAPSEKLTIGAKPDEEWKFVKWTVNGEDYS